MSYGYACPSGAHDTDARRTNWLGQFRRMIGIDGMAKKRYTPLSGQ